jgi:hypothetical protein
LGESVALIPFSVAQGDTCADIKVAINTALQNYQYFVYNGEWVMWAADLLEGVDRSYGSTILSENEVETDTVLGKYKQFYGYLYYSANKNNIDDTYDTLLSKCSGTHANTRRKHLNVIYDLRGSINILPVVGEHCALEIDTFTINSQTGNMSLTVKTHNNMNTSRFQFVEFMGTEIFKDTNTDALDEMLSLTVLSKYSYSSDINQSNLLPENMVQGYGTLYENNMVHNIVKPDNGVLTNLKSQTIYDIRTDVEDANTNRNFASLQTILKYFSSTSSTKIYTYSDEELETWALYKEFINYNVYSQPLLQFKDEIYKASCDTGGNSPETKLCSGSLESWKTLNEGTISESNSLGLPPTNPQPTYQTLHLKDINGLLKVMYRYYDVSNPENTFNSEYFGGSVSNYSQEYQQSDIAKSILWSITRNTPPFWGNLCYNRGNLESPNLADLYQCGGNFNILPDASNSSIFKHRLSETCLLKPFCEDVAETDQHILWKHIMQYTGGNKRELQLTRNVTSEHYNDYVNTYKVSNTGRPEFLTDRNIGRETQDTSDHIGIPYERIGSFFGQLQYLTRKARHEYVARSLLDWNRLDLDVSNGCSQSSPDLTSLLIGHHSNEYLHTLYNTIISYTTASFDGNISTNDYVSLMANGLIPRWRTETRTHCGLNSDDAVDDYLIDVMQGDYDSGDSYAWIVNNSVSDDVINMRNGLFAGHTSGSGSGGYLQTTPKPGWYWDFHSQETGSPYTQLQNNIDEPGQWDTLFARCGVTQDLNRCYQTTSDDLPTNHIFRGPGTTEMTSDVVINIAGSPIKKHSGAQYIAANLNTAKYINALTHIPDNEDAVNYEKSTAWGPPSSDGTRWATFNDSNTTDHTFLHGLTYKDDISESDDDTNLRRWGLSTSDSLQPTFTVVNDFNKLTHIDPDNSENHMGILYTDILFTNDGGPSNFDQTTEYFGQNKEVNLYKYPHICEPWLLRTTYDDSNHVQLPEYTNDIIKWTAYYRFNPLTAESIADMSGMDDIADIDDADLTTTAIVRPAQIVQQNKFYNMLHPLSITIAKPREKSIFVDITPNNDILFPTEDAINVTYFRSIVETGGGPTVSLTSSDTHESLLDSDTHESNEVIVHYGNNIIHYDGTVANDGDTVPSPLYWLHPGIGGTATDMSTLTGGTYPGSKTVIVGISTVDRFTDTSANHNMTPSSMKANLRVGYFKATNDLLHSTVPALLEHPHGYTFTDAFINTITDSPTSMKPSSTSDNLTVNVFYNSPDGVTGKNRLSLDDTYYNEHLPPQQPDTTPVGRELFGGGSDRRGFMSMSPTNTLPAIDGVTITDEALAPGIPLADRYNDDQTIDFYTYLDPGTTLPPAMTYFNINMVFPTDGDAGAVDICKDLIKSKLSVCGNYNNWTSPTKEGCVDCFEVDNPTSRGLCPRYPDFVGGSGSGGTAPQLGVCGVLNTSRENNLPWEYIDVTHQPQEYGENLPLISPYNMDDRQCNNISDIPLDFIALQHAGENGETGSTENVAFFKPARSGSSDVFEDSHTTELSETAFGCMRQDLSLMKADDFRLSCNTNLSTPVERDKHVIINFIIAHSDDLNTSQRTKLAIMSEEELLHKALSLGINLETINDYTRPQLHTKVRDILLPNMCEDGSRYCTTDEDCGGHYSCGLYEEWNDLQKYYYNIQDPSTKSDFTSRKQWEYIGCGIDLNYSDSTSGESVCKDKYPGLCEQNIEKCSSENDAVRNAIMLDCPETCQVQFKDLSRFKGEQIGDLSICTSRGRCKWSHDQDESNLLPPCEEHTSRELGSTLKCRNYNSMTNGPEAGTCNLATYPGTIDSPVCAEQRCMSMQGCKFTSEQASYCRLPSSVDHAITREEDCPQGGRWVGAAVGGQCIMSERDEYDLLDMADDCSILGGTVVQGRSESCEYQPDIPYTGEDPCSHTVDLDDLTESEQLQYFFSANTSIHVASISPVSLDGNTETHPHYIEITLTHPLGSETIRNFESMVGMSDTYPKHKFLYIDNNSGTVDTLCSQYVLGKSKIVKLDNSEGVAKITIGGPNKAYILPRDTTGNITIGGPTACECRGVYDLESYYTNSEGSVSSTSSTTDSSLRAAACYQNPDGACTYEHTSTHCVSCSLYKDEQSCFGNNNPGEFSRCGWGSIKDVCGVIGDMDECRKMHLDGCEWNPDTQTCSLNKLTDDDGNPLVDKVGCIKCDDIQHQHTCNGMKNCFWDKLTNTDGDNIGQCRACSSIGDPNGEGISVDNATWDPIQGNDYNAINACDDFQLTGGQCEFRNPSSKVTGMEEFGLSKLEQDYEDILQDIWDVISDPLGETPIRNENECVTDSTKCTCSPARLYPLFPDWILHNLLFLLVFLPFGVYFMYAWWQVFVSPTKFTDNKTKSGKGVMGDIKDKVSGMFKSDKDSSSTPDATDAADISGGGYIGGGKDNSEVFEALTKAITELNETTKSTSITKQIGQKMKGKAGSFWNSTKSFFTASKWTDRSIFDTTIMKDSSGVNITTEWLDIGTDGTILEPFAMFNKVGLDGKAQFAALSPTTDPTQFKYNAGFYLKLLFVLISLPFTIIQYLAHNIRLSPAIRVGNAFLKLGDSIRDRWIIPPGIPIGLILAFICGVLGVVSMISITLGLFVVGIKILKHIMEQGLVPNPDYVDPVEGVPHTVMINEERVNLPAAAVWWQQGYREEWDDMIKDPISDAVVQQRESLLPDFLQGDVNDEDNVSDAYDMAYLNTEPDDLNWSKYIRTGFRYYNNFINRIGDNFIFYWLVIPYILFKYITTISNYLPMDGQEFNLKSFVTYTIIYAVIMGLISALMMTSDATEGEYDGVEKKCYGDIPTPFKLGNDDINYPKICMGDSVDDDKDECPYGCYYIGEGQYLEDDTSNPDYGKKCKDNRSVLSLGSIFDPDPTLNIPFDMVGAIPDSWNTVVPEPGKGYTCPPSSRFISKYPYDSLCSTTAKRCRATHATMSSIPDPDEYCEILYMKNDHNDTKCINNFTDAGDTYSDEMVANAAKGPLIGEGLVECKLETPYDGFKSDTHCPFPLPSAENTFFSEKGDTRESVSLWAWMYDKIENPGRDSSCGYQCAKDANGNPQPCSPEDIEKADTCRAIPITSEDETICTNNVFPDGTTCEYYPGNAPLQTIMQNQERYLIVNQDYGENLFS